MSTVYLLTLRQLTSKWRLAIMAVLAVVPAIIALAMLSQRTAPPVQVFETVVLGAILFAISIVGIFLNRRNVIIILMAIELMLLAVNTNFVAFSHYLGDIHGQVFVFFVLTVAAAEAAIGLAILVTLFRSLDTINVEDLDQLKG